MSDTVTMKVQLSDDVWVKYDLMAQAKPALSEYEAHIKELQRQAEEWKGTENVFFFKNVPTWDGCYSAWIRKKFDWWRLKWRELPRLHSIFYGDLSTSSSYLVALHEFGHFFTLAEADSQEINKNPLNKETLAWEWVFENTRGEITDFAWGEGALAYSSYLKKHADQVSPRDRAVFDRLLEGAGKYRVQIDR